MKYEENNSASLMARENGREDCEDKYAVDGKRANFPVLKCSSQCLILTSITPSSFNIINYYSEVICLLLVHSHSTVKNEVCSSSN